MRVAIHTERSPGMSTPHIGPAHHRRRNLWLATGFIGLAVAIASYYVYWRGHNVVATDRLAQFQAAYAERCDSAAFAPTATTLARKAYLGSLSLQRVVDRQLSALQSGAPCDEVYRALRAADFPLLSAGPPPPRAATIDVQPPPLGAE